MRRSIDDMPLTSDELPAGADDASPVSWAVAVGDDYDDSEPRVILTMEALGQQGTGLVAHLPAAAARRLRLAIRDALREIGEPHGE